MLDMRVSRRQIYRMPLDARHRKQGRAIADQGGGRDRVHVRQARKAPPLVKPKTRPRYDGKAGRLLPLLENHRPLLRFCFAVAV